MTIDWQHFTPWSALGGGALIGLAAAMFVLLNGRIAGISGVLGGLLNPTRGDIGWRVAFVAGLVGAPLAYRLLGALPVPHIDAGTGALVLAGLLVGVGTRYGAGCTSGHGVCGLSRLSPRSLVATLAFIGAGFAMVFVVRHVLGVLKAHPMQLLTSLLAGLVFGLGLILSGMADPAKVLGFLDLAGAWDPSLALVMGGAIAVGLPAFAWTRRRSVSLLGAPMRLPTARTIDRRLVGGSLLFGIGWGIAGFCPGPALVALGMGESRALVFVAAMVAGMGVFALLEERGRHSPRG